MWPGLPINGRAAYADTILPTGGGPDGQSPIFVHKGQRIVLSTYSMHRRTDIWGEDANEFRPERWEDLRPLWAYVPFSGGSRICIGRKYS